MITPYYGEFLISPVPLELSLNACSHGCVFCFALLNQPHRQTAVTPIFKFLQRYRDLDSLEARLLTLGYPVLISNRVDPFANSNYQQTVPLLRTMAELELPVSLQTRGGRGIPEVLDFLPPSVWYISINTQDDRLRKQLEPGAPDMASRFRLMEELRAKGHSVVLGLNPVVEEWLPDPELIIQRAKESGVQGVWVEPLHLNTTQIGNMSEAKYAAIGETIIQRSRKKTMSEEEWAFFQDTRAIVEYNGLPVFSMGQGNPSTFHQVWKDVYPKLFPTWQDLVNRCVEKNVVETDLLHWKEVWDKVFAPHLPAGVIPSIRGYVASKNRDVLYDGKFLAGKMTFEYLFKIFWSDGRLPSCPVRGWAFSWPVEPFSEKLDTQFMHEDGTPWMCYTPGHYGRTKMYAGEVIGG